MAPVFVRASSAWKEVTELFVRASSAWKGWTTGHIRASSAWKEFYSSTGLMIAFFTAAPGATMQVCNGSGESVSLDDHFPMGASVQGSSTGAHTHQHDNKVMDTGAAGAYWGSGTLVNTALRQTHVHDASHQHASLDHQPQYYELIPAVPVAGADLPSGAILFWNDTSATVPAGWTYFNHPDRWLKCNVSAAGGERANNTHTHSHTGYTGYTGPVSMQSGYALFGTQWAGNASHRHTMSHTHAAYTNNPSSITLVPMSCDSDTAFADIPSGAIAFFQGDVVPSGWTRYSAADDRLIKFSTTAGTTSGAATHTHGSLAVSTSTATMTSLKTNNGSSCAADTHAHGMTHDHSDAKTIMPKCFGLILCEKD